MKKLLTVKSLVKTILTEKPETRDDDELLWLVAVDTVAKNQKREWVCDLRFKIAVAYLRELGLPTFETVSRARRKLQEEYPELRGSENARRGRAKKEQTFKEFARL